MAGTENTRTEGVFPAVVAARFVRLTALAWSGPYSALWALSALWGLIFSCLSLRLLGRYRCRQ